MAACHFRGIVAAGLSLGLIASVVAADDKKTGAAERLDEAKSINAKVVSLSAQRKYREAVPLARQALVIRKILAKAVLHRRIRANQSRRQADDRLHDRDERASRGQRFLRRHFRHPEMMRASSPS